MGEVKTQMELLEKALREADGEAEEGDGALPEGDAEVPRRGRQTLAEAFCLVLALIVTDERECCARVVSFIHS